MSDDDDDGDNDNNDDDNDNAYDDDDNDDAEKNVFSCSGLGHWLIDPGARWKPPGDDNHPYHQNF